MKETLYNFCVSESPIMQATFSDRIKRFIEDHFVQGSGKLSGKLSGKFWLKNLIFCEVEDYSGEKTEYVIQIYIIEDISKNKCEQCDTAGFCNTLVAKSYQLIIPRGRGTSQKKNLNDPFLQGILHLDGSGHLITLQGVEGGSRGISKRHLMDLWDRICTVISPREISVIDAYVKDNMEARLLYAISDGGSWFAQWGYSFRKQHGGTTERNYKNSILLLSSIRLKTILKDFADRWECRLLKSLFDYYRNRGENWYPSTSLGEIMKTMMVRAHVGDSQEKQKVMDDFWFLYNVVLQDYPNSYTQLLFGMSVNTILWSKLFVKAWGQAQKLECPGCGERLLDAEAKEEANDGAKEVVCLECQQMDRQNEVFEE